MESIVKSIIKNATTLEQFEPEPIKNRFNIRTFIWCVDNIPDNYICERINILYFYNDRAGFFNSNKNNIVNLASNIEEWDTGIDQYIEIDKMNMGAVGTRILVNTGENIVVYKIVGFLNSDHTSDNYFNIK